MEYSLFLRPVRIRCGGRTRRDLRLIDTRIAMDDGPYGARTQVVVGQIDTGLLRSDMRLHVDL